MIQLQFCSESALASAMIHVYGHTWCSHVDTILPDGRLLGARYSGGVAVREPNYAKFSSALSVDLPASEEVTRRYYELVLAEVGKPYDSAAIAAFVFGREWRRDDAWFCSELVAAKLEEARFFSYRLATQSNRVTPSDLLLALSAVTNIFGPTG